MQPLLNAHTDINALSNLEKAATYKKQVWSLPRMGLLRKSLDRESINSADVRPNSNLDNKSSASAETQICTTSQLLEKRNESSNQNQFSSKLVSHFWCKSPINRTVSKIGKSASSLDDLRGSKESQVESRECQPLTVLKTSWQAGWACRLTNVSDLSDQSDNFRFWSDFSNVFFYTLKLERETLWRH